MCQRVMIAMALSCNPRVLIADEPTTALDVTIQAQVLDLLRELQHKHGTSVLLISHDLGVLSDHAERIMVMYAGRMVELAPTADLFLRPLHPYTVGLLQCMPTLLHPPEVALPSIPGSPPDLTDLGRGCAFAPRCGFAVDRCERERPEFLALTRESGVRQLGGRRAACFEIDRVAATELYARGGEDPA
jgi:oligopeptide/dipeptide ABC transporter ATP-binding protein